MRVLLIKPAPDTTAAADLGWRDMWDAPTMLPLIGRRGIAPPNRTPGPISLGDLS